MCKSCVKEAPKASFWKRLVIGVIVFPWLSLIAGAIALLKAIEPMLHSFGICTGI